MIRVNLCLFVIPSFNQFTSIHKAFRMKYCYLLFNMTLLVSTIIALGQHQNPNSTDAGTEETLRRINGNVDMIISMMRAGFMKLETRINQIQKYIVSKLENNAANENYVGSSYWNFNNSSSTNYSFNIYDEIDYEACRNESSRTGPFHEFSLHGPAGETPLRDFERIPESEQPLLKAVRLSNLNIEFSILLKSLKFCCNLEELILQEVTLSFSNGNYTIEEVEIYLPNLRKFSIQFSKLNRNRKHLAHLLPFKKTGSKFNTEIIITNLPWSSFTFRVVPSIGRIEANYYVVDEKVLSNLEPDFDLKELVIDDIDVENSLQVEYIPNSLRLLKLGYFYPAGNGRSLRDILQKFRMLKHFSYSSSPYGKIRNSFITLEYLPETLESLSLRTIPLKYVPGIKFPALERIEFDGNILDEEILEHFSAIFPNLKKLVLETSDSEVVKRLLNLPGLNQLVVRGSNFYVHGRENKFNACHKDHWCNVSRDTSGNWAGADITVEGDLLQRLVDNIFPEFKDFSEH